MPNPEKVLPLSALSAVVLDLETTGLDVRADRIVQIGALGLVNGQVDEQDIYAVNVDPQIDIPARSVRIHGLSADKLDGCPTFEMVFEDLLAFIGNRPIIGFNIGFDLAILQNEAARLGIIWTPPPALCLRLLSRAVYGTAQSAILSNLEELASHFNISQEGRHSALGDARITADVLLRLVPHLNAAGVRTFSEAQKQIARLVSERSALVRSGWLDIVDEQDQERPRTAQQRIDPFVFRQQLGSIAKSPATLLTADTTLAMAAQQMLKDGTDCAFVGRNTAQISGIISERDILRTLALEPEKAAKTKVVSVMSSPIHGMGEDSYLHVALGRMARLGIRHLAVYNGYGHLSGWVSVRELVHCRGAESYALGDGILAAETPGLLAKSLAKLPQIAESLLADYVPARDVAAIISTEYQLVTQRAAELAEAEMRQSGAGAPPVPWALLILGSAGRGESMLAADQDHAIIFEDPADPAEIENCRKWFMDLGARISDILDQARIPYCKGGVMSKHPQWCRSIAEWHQAIASWVQRAKPEDLLNIDIFFDFKTVAGYPELGERLNKLVLSAATRKPQFLKMLAAKAAGYSPPTNLLGRFKTVDGRIDLKMGGLLPIVEMARIIAICSGAPVRATSERIALLADKENIPVTLSRLDSDHQMLITIILQQQLRDLEAGIPPGNKVEARHLTIDQKKQLKACFGRLQELDGLMRDILF